MHIWGALHTGDSLHIEDAMHTGDPMHMGTLKAREKGQAVRTVHSTSVAGAQHLWGCDCKGCCTPREGYRGAACPLHKPQLPATEHTPLVQKHRPTPQTAEIPVVSPKASKTGTSLPESPELWEPPPSWQPLHRCRGVCRERKAPKPLCDAQSQVPPSPRAVLALAAASWARGGWKHPRGCRICPLWYSGTKRPGARAGSRGERCGFQPRRGAEPR